MYYFVYKITNCINNKYYIGVHQTTDLNDGYMGSGIILHQAYKKYGIENFKREILEFFDNPIDMFDLERFLVTQTEVNSENCYNTKLGGYGGWDNARTHRTKESFLKMMETKRKKGYVPPMFGKHHTDESNEKNRIEHLGKKHSEETKKKMSESRKGEKHFLYGKHHSEETKKKISESHKGKNKSKPKYKWLTPDGDIRIMDMRNAKIYHKDWKLIINDN